MSRQANQQTLNARMLKAIKKNDLAALKKSIESGADVHFEGDKALISAAADASPPLVKYLLECGANPHAREGLALKWAVLQVTLEYPKTGEWMEGLKLLLDLGVKVSDEQIIYTAKVDEIACCELLLRHVLDPKLWRKKKPQAALAKAAKLRKIINHGEDGPKYFIERPTIKALLAVIEDCERPYHHEIRRQALLANPIRPKLPQPPHPL